MHVAEEREMDFRTGERVEQGGEYTCDSGECQAFEAGEIFATCPETGEDTRWRKDDTTS